MSDISRGNGSQDPLEQYRQALRRRHTPGGTARAAAEEPPAPDVPPAAARPLERNEPLELGEPLAAEAPLELGEPLAAEAPLELGEPLATEAPLELGEPLAAEAPLELGEPLAVDEPLELGDPLAAKVPLQFDQPLPAKEPPAPVRTRTAADWLGLDEQQIAEDPLGGADPLAREAAPQTASGDDQGGEEVDDDLPEDLQDTLARYRKAMSKLRESRDAKAADPLATPQAGPGGPPQGPKPEPGDGSEVLDKYRKAVNRKQSDAGGASARAARAPGVSRQTLDQFRKKRAGRPDARAADDFAVEDLVPDPPARARAAPNARRRAPLSPAGAPGWRIRAMTFGVLLLAALPVQWLVYTRLGVAFAPVDLGVGLSALLPAALILLLARPVSGKGQLVMVVGSAVVALIGSAGFAYGLSLLQNELPQGASLVFGLLLTLGLFTAVWGPLFLILVPILSRTSLPARGSS